MEENKQQTPRKRIFINDVDSYSSKHIAKFLATFVAGERSEEAEEETVDSPQGEPLYQVVGTVSASSKEENEGFLYELYSSPTQDELLGHLLECDVVVFNISESSSQKQVEEATWVLTALQAKMETFTSQKLFILVSTVMTWAMSKRQTPDDEDAMLTEEHYIRRRPHPSFRNHNSLEKLVLQLHGGRKSKLRGFVVASGLQYGKGENLFHYFFKVSWLMQLPKVPLFGSGTNYIPMIHIIDLAGVIQNIIEVKPKLKSKYILAVDDSKNTLGEIVKIISDTLGPGKINILPEEEAITMNAFQLEELKCLDINLRLEAFAVKDSLSLNWRSEGGMLENIKSIVEEYKVTRQLLPIKILLVGPPAVGKSTVAEKLCSFYQIHHLRIKDIIEEKLSDLREISDADDTEQSVSVGEAAAAQKQLDLLNKSMETNNGRLADHLLFNILQEKLLSPPCMNQGFVLDGFPMTYAQTQMIFTEKVTEEEDPAHKIPAYNKTIAPEHVFALNASDEFLTKRAQGLPQSVAEEMGCTQDEFTARLQRYRERFSAEETLLDYFDEIEIHPEHIDVNTDDPDYTDVIKKITEAVGAPKNYGRTPEEERRMEREERRKKLAAEAAERKRRNDAALAEMAAQHKDWQRNWSEVKKQEQELLEARCIPLRNYLMKYVMPTLTEAMLECSKIKPEDPVDFLAEYLLRKNPQEQQREML